METLFLHVCCGPCAAYPLEHLRADRPDLKPELWFYNPNIHPRVEFHRRRDSLAYFAIRSNLTVDFSPPYEATDFLATLGSAISPPDRCRICYAQRLAATATEATRRGYRLFGSTLAFSRHQNQELLIEEGHRAAAAHDLEFYYEDWRPGWRRGHKIAREMGLYHQNYCGCIYSELER